MFTISQMEQFSGIKAHTIRMWEQRYNALSPARSDGNTRYYDGDQLRRLLNIVSVKESPKKIAVSKICQMSDEVLHKYLSEQVLQQVTAENQNDEYLISQLISATISFDEIYFNKLFALAELQMGVRDAYIRIIYPVLERIGLLWSMDDLSPAHEHFASNLIRQKLSSAIDKITLSNDLKESWLLFLPENEFHENGLLLAQYLIRSSGRKVVYLGSNVPKQVLQATINAVNPTHIYFFLVHLNTVQACQEYFGEINKLEGVFTTYISGNPKLLKDVDITPNITWLKTVNDLELKLK